MRLLAIAGALVGASIVAAQDSIVPPHRIDGETVVVFQAWVAAVNDHRPGVKDAVLEKVAALSIQERRDLSAGMALFLEGLENKGRLDTLENDSMPMVKQIGHRAAQNPGTTSFLRRAALLHADAAILAASYVVETAHTDDSAPPSRRRGPEPEIPILTQHRLSAGNDGRQLGEIVVSWHWPFARFLLDVLEKTNPGDAFIGDWYHATSAFMLAQRSWGELDPQNKRAGVLLPRDARSLFDRACYAETLGLPLAQSFVEPSTVVPPGGTSLNWTARPPAGASGIPPAGVADAEAERLFKRVLEFDPRYTEARVRLARLLDLHGRHEQALAELTNALAQDPPAAVAFYAHLFAGRAAQAARQIDRARDHYAAALSLFPRSQSAALGLSQVEVILGKVEGAREHAGRAATGNNSDPWWQYHFGAGRDAEALLNALRQSVSR